MAKQGVKNRTEGQNERTQNILEWYEALISAVVVLAVIFSFVFRIMQVSGESMWPTLWSGDKLLCWGAGYTPQRGDIVILDSNTSYGKPLVKRIIALGGDTVYIDFEAGTVSVNGEELNEDYLEVPTLLSYDVEFPVTVPEGTVFVMGDNRNNSLDSRSSSVGYIDERDVLGKVLFCFMPGASRFE
jgi:signal peptidase I